ncbi:MAG: hypothetical protein DRO93_03545 [Candidatus Thorarchaeota archaeon]|nr:MAG: hypothetical protein DRO93_03545 [Candidatus Thorarchaeota archaeon]
MLRTETDVIRHQNAHAFLKACDLIPTASGLKTMNSRRFTLVIIALLFLPPTLILSQPQEVKAWGLATHSYIDTHAMNALTNESWREAFRYYSGEVLQGASIPDLEWQDWDNHLYYPETGEHNAPNAAAHWYQLARANFTAGNWEDGFFAAGVMSHYACDPCIPVHTDEYWDGHPAYETDINNHLSNFSLPAPSESVITNVSHLVVDCATYAHQYYDEIYAAYPNGDSKALDTNEDIMNHTTLCLSMAVNACLSLFHNLTIGIDPPEIDYELTHVAVIDYAHGNDYTNGYLTDVEVTLNKHGYAVRIQEDPFTAADLIDVDLLVMTCAHTGYSSSELSVIVDWAASGNKSILLTGRGDYSTYTNPEYPNDVLEAIGSHIRLNHDNVYMEGTYKPWYIDLYDIPSPSDTVNLTYGVANVTLFSPNSLYFTDERPVLPIIFADPTGYQTDQNAPAIERVYDNTQDGENGQQIPLMAVEEIETLRVMVAGTTFFSNYDHQKSFDNIVLFGNIVEWAKSNRSEFNPDNADEIGPAIGDVWSDPSSLVAMNNVTLFVNVTDVSGVASVNLTYTLGSTSNTLSMTKTSSGSYSVVVSLDSEGELRVTIRAADGAGNVAVRATFTFEVAASTTTTTTSTTTSETTTSTTTETTSTTSVTSTGTTSAPTTTTQSGPMGTTFVFAAAAIAVIVVVVVILLIKKR